MSNFIVPISSLPTMQSITEVGAGGGVNPVADQQAGGSFAGILQDAIQNMAVTGETSSQNMYNLALGSTDDLHTGAIDSLKSSTAISYASGLASSAIQAYNELMRIQI